MFYWEGNAFCRCLLAETAQLAGEDVEGGQQAATHPQFNHLCAQRENAETSFLT